MRICRAEPLTVLWVLMCISQVPGHLLWAPFLSLSQGLVLYPAILELTVIWLGHLECWDDSSDSLTIFNCLLKKHWVLDLLCDSLALAPLVALELTVHIRQASNSFDPPVSASWMLWLQACASTLGCVKSCPFVQVGCVGMHVKVRVSALELAFLNFMWAPGIELMVPGLFACSKLLYFVNCLSVLFVWDSLTISGCFGTHRRPVIHIGLLVSVSRVLG